MKKIMILMSCVAIILSAMVFTKDNSIFAANVYDTFVEGDFTYKITDVGDVSRNGEVEISDYDETSTVTTLTIPNTVEKDGKTFDVVSASRIAFEGANNVKNLNIPENFIDISTKSFVKFNEDNLTVESALETIVVDENNSVLEVIDGVLYNVKNGEEDLLLYPYNSSKKEFIVPDLLINGGLSYLFDVIYYALHLESVVVPFESNDGLFTQNGMLCQWVDKNDHSQGCYILMIPQAMNKTIVGKNVVDASLGLSDGGYAVFNKTTEYVVEGNSRYQSIDGCLYEGDTLLIYPGGIKNTIYRIPESTKAIGEGDGFVFLGNRNLRSLIIPSSVNSVVDFGISSFSLKSIRIEGEGNITWGADNFVTPNGDNMYNHIYVDNGNTTIKSQIQAIAPHLTDDYFHEVGAVPTTSITDIKTNIENKKDVKVTWSATRASDNYEVRRYDASGEYVVVGSTTNTSFVDTTTTYNTKYQYEVVPYTLPVTSSNDAEDPLHDYRTYGTASNKVSIETPRETTTQSYKGTYTYKQADGKEVSVVKEIEANTSAIQQAPELPEVKGYVFEKWTTDLTNPEKVDKDFTAKAVYKVKENKPEIKPDDKINKPSDEVKTGDETNIAVLITLFVMTGLIAVVVKKKHDKN